MGLELRWDETKRDETRWALCVLRTNVAMLRPSPKTSDINMLCQYSHCRIAEFEYKASERWEKLLKVSWIGVVLGKDEVWTHFVFMESDYMCGHILSSSRVPENTKFRVPTNGTICLEQVRLINNNISIVNSLNSWFIKSKLVAESRRFLKTDKLA